MRALLIFNRNIINVHNILAVLPLSNKSWLSWWLPHADWFRYPLSFWLLPYQEADLTHSIRSSACGWQLTSLRTISLDNISREHVRFVSVGRLWATLSLGGVCTPSDCKWNESGLRPPLCTYRLNWARRTSWGWWDDWDDTVFQTQDSKFEPWRSEAEDATSRSRRLPTILTFTRGWGRNIFCFFQTAETGNRTPNSGVKGSGANHYPRAPAPSDCN